MSRRRGLITVLGRFVVLDTPRPFLRRCGSASRLRVGAGWAADPRLVVWRSARERLSGRLLPSLRPFTLRLPAKLVSARSGGARSFSITPDAGRLYLLTPTGYWWTRAPLTKSGPEALNADQPQPAISSATSTAAGSRHRRYAAAAA